MQRRFLPAVAVIFLLGLGLNVLIYSVVLRRLIAETPVMDVLPKIVGELIFATVFVWIWFKGLTPAPTLMQGVRYGLAIGLLYHAAGMLQISALVPLSGRLVAGAALLGIGKAVVLGVAVAMVTGPGAPGHAAQP